MGNLVDLIHGSGLAIWVRESPSLFAYTTVLALHAMGLAIVVGASTAIALRALGLVAAVPMPAMLKLYPLIWVGFTVNALSGFALLAANLPNLLQSVVFLLKLALVFLAVIATEFLRASLSRPAVAAGVVQVGTSARARALAVATIVLWLAALVTGRLTAYPNFVSGFFN